MQVRQWGAGDGSGTPLFFECLLRFVGAIKKGGEHRLRSEGTQKKEYNIPNEYANQGNMDVEHPKNEPGRKRENPKYEQQTKEKMT